MCFAYFKMKRFEKNPKKYIKDKSSFFPEDTNSKAFIEMQSIVLIFT